MSYIGHKQSFIDSKAKVSGRAKYIEDLNLDGMVYAKILRSPHPHARIKSICTEKAKALPGVHAVITAADCPNHKFGLSHPDVTMLAIDKVRYVGDEVAAVAADTPEIAEAALELIEADYEVLEPVLDVHEALKPGAILVHDDVKNNIPCEYHFQEGDIEADFASCDYIIERTYSTHRVSGLYLEPFGGIAEWGSDGRLIMHTGLQAPFQGRNEIAKALGIDPTRVTIKSPFIGGGFGAKIWIRNFHPIIAVLAKKVGRPVKYVMTREEEMLTTRPRVAPEMTVKLGMMNDGTMVCKETKIIGDNGAYSWAAPKILNNMSIRTDCLYRYRSTKTDSYLVYTNLLPTSGFRGYGNSQSHFAVESIIDEACAELGLDPVEVRLKNCVRQGDKTLHGWNLRSCELAACIEQARDALNAEPLVESEQNGRIRRGRALCIMTHVSGNRGGDNFDGSNAMVRIQEGGQMYVFSGEPDLGQGARTVFAQIAAETMGMNMADIIVMPIDTDITPFAMGTYSSRVTTVGGRAVQLAVKELRKEVLALAAANLEVPVEDLTIKNSVVYSSKDESKKLDMAEIARLAIRTNQAKPLTVYYTYDPPTEGANARGYGDYSSAYSFGAHAVEVEVDTHTGKVQVKHVVAAHDVGRVVNPGGVLGQIYGGIAQGIGWTLYEDIKHDDKGFPLVTGLHQYTLMTTEDMPKMTPICIESNDPIGPFGAKGVGEPTLIPTAPAIANAIDKAVGVRVRDLPITAEKVFMGILENEEAKSDEAGCPLVS